MNCRHCGTDLELPLVDLGSAPPSNAYLTAESLHSPEKWFPLRVLVCEECWLVQTEDFTQADELFNEEYAYFSGVSKSWLEHSKRYKDEMTERFGLTETSHVVEVAANDGYLLQYFKQAGIPCTGVEPTASTAAAAREKGIPIVEEFFGVSLAESLIVDGKQADLTAANNVLAHVPNINDFVSGFAILLKEQGVSTFEFPHLAKLVAEHQFDTIYHEHFSYLSLTAVDKIFSENGLSVFDVQEHPTHGGSLRVFAQRSDTGENKRTENVVRILKEEAAAGMKDKAYYGGFQAVTEQVKDDLLGFLLEAKRQGKSVAAYGAAAKGNTMMNFAGIRNDLISYVVDRSPSKQDKFMPGSRIPIVEESMIAETKPDYIVILPWNIKNEVMEQLDYVKAWGGQFVTAIPNLAVI